MRAYRWNPSLQCIIKLELLAVVSFKDEFAVELGEGDAVIGVKVFRVCREVWTGGFGGYCSVVDHVGRLLSKGASVLHLICIEVVLDYSRTIIA